LSGLWDNALVFGGTEVAPTFGGFLEGALEAAEQAHTALATG
jgi:monoamine oxidase